MRPATTVVLLRDSPKGPEVLLTVRPKGLRFMGGAVVFPGGAVAPADLDERWEQVSTRSRSDAAAALDDSDEAAALGAFVCCLREAFEEVGLVLAAGPVSELKRSDADDSGKFLKRCLELGIVLDTAALQPAGRSVTPPGSPVRFDARFFVARAPRGWEPQPNPKEVEGCFWMTPAAALEALAAGEMIMAPPTIEMLQQLLGFAELDTILAGARAGALAHLDGPLRAQLAPLVAVVLAPNPGVMTGPGTNTYIVGSGPTCVIDPAVDQQDYLDAVLDLAGEVTSILVTHRHPDHVGGASALAERTGASVRAFGGHPAGAAKVDPLEDGQVVEAGGTRLTAIHAPGHTSDHLCFMLDEGNSLFAGDNVLGEGTAVIAPPDGDMSAYITSLKRLRRLDLGRIYPGHFRPIEDGPGALDRYLAHRAQRQAAILEAVGDPSDVDDIVSRVYTDTPAHLHPVAAYQVRAHLQLLEEEGRVARAGMAGKDVWIRVDR